MNPIGPGPRYAAQFLGGLVAGAVIGPAPGPAPGRLAHVPARAPDLAPARAPDPVVPGPGPAGPDAPGIIPFLPAALQPERHGEDRWLVPVIVVAVVGVSLSLAAAAWRWVRRLGIPIRD